MCEQKLDVGFSIQSQCYKLDAGILTFLVKGEYWNVHPLWQKVQASLACFLPCMTGTLPLTKVLGTSLNFWPNVVATSCTSSAKLTRRTNFVIFSVEWLTCHTHGNYRKLWNCSPSEVYIWCHNRTTISWMNPCLWQMIAENCGIYII